jgi:hypothetical protein
MAKPDDTCLGLSKKKFKVNKTHTFFIYGAEIAGQPGGLPKAYFTSSSHIWSDVVVAKLPGAQPHNDGIEVKARCVKKKKVAPPKSGDGTDDLTVTLVFTDGGGAEEINECCFEDVTYEDP